jgi:hypothetical protein
MAAQATKCRDNLLPNLPIFSGPQTLKNTEKIFNTRLFFSAKFHP